MKASIDTHRQRAVWELGMELHWNESKATNSLKEANATCSCATQDAEALCFTTVKRAKVTYTQTIQEAKITQACTIWEAKATHSAATRDTETWRASQAELLQRQHGKVMQDLEEQVIQQESNCKSDFLSACQACLICQPSRAQRHAGGFLPGFVWAGSCIPLILFVAKDLPNGGPACSSSSPPHLCPSSLPGPKRQHPSPRSCGQQASRWNHTQDSPGRAPQLQKARGPALE